MGPPLEPPENLTTDGSARRGATERILPQLVQLVQSFLPVTDLAREHASQGISIGDLRVLLSSGPAGASRINRALHAAVAEGDLLRTSQLLTAGADPNRRLLGKPVLLQAAMSGEIEVLRLLLEAGADPNASDSLGVQALSRVEESEAAELLIVAGANPNSMDRFRETALIRSCRAGDSRASVVATLLQYGALVDLADDEGRTALHEAVSVGAANVVSLLISDFACVNLTDASGATPLHLVASATRCSSAHTSILAQLLIAGAKPSVISHCGTPVSALLSAFFGSRMQRLQSATECVSSLGTLLAAGCTLMEGVEDALRWLVVLAGKMDEATAATISDTDLINFLKRQTVLRPQRVA